MAATAPAVKGLPAIAASYERTDAFLGNLRDSCEAAGNAGERDRVARERELNDQAWFVLAWGQLETEIDDACRDAIQSGKSHREWRYRRVWGMFDQDNPRLSFRNRLSLVLDRNSDLWRRTVELYEVRNQVAHGELRSEGIDVSTVIEDFYRIHASLVRD
ncbi:MAG: hypothetical protein OXD36_17890 [Rhodobacter sp.]|nr:hypothetical protein [Rhodobacter sp.]